MAVKVSEIMSSPVHSIDINKSAKDAGQMLRKIRRGFLVVTKGGKPVGTMSDSDLIQKVVAENKLSSKIKIKDIMSSPIVTVGKDEDVLVAVRKMKLNNVHRLPVMGKGKLVGVLSLTDIARTSPELQDLLEYRLKMKEEPVVLREQETSGICDSCGNYFIDLRNANEQWLCESCRSELEEKE